MTTAQEHDAPAKASEGQCESGRAEAGTEPGHQQGETASSAMSEQLPNSNEGAAHPVAEAELSKDYVNQVVHHPQQDHVFVPGVQTMQKHVEVPPDERIIHVGSESLKARRHGKRITLRDDGSWVQVGNTWHPGSGKDAYSGLGDGPGPPEMHKHVEAPQVECDDQAVRELMQEQVFGPSLQPVQKHAEVPQVLAYTGTPNGSGKGGAGVSALLGPSTLPHAQYGGSFGGSGFDKGPDPPQAVAFKRGVTRGQHAKHDSALLEVPGQAELGLEYGHAVTFFPPAGSALSLLKFWHRQVYVQVLHCWHSIARDAVFARRLDEIEEREALFSNS